jgi:pimeloyl-ACP methyl ester carboxylesterase
LAESFLLVMPDRRGYGRSPPSSLIDYERDAEDIAELLGEGAHLVGESYGAVGSLLAAGLRPEAVLSLTVIEPPLFTLVRGNPDADEMAEKAGQVFAATRDASPEEFVAEFNRAVGFDALPSTLDSESRGAVESMMRERPPMDARAPYHQLKRARFSKLVLSGGWSGVFEAICDELAVRIGAERAVVPGAGHSPYMTGSAFNERLKAFLASAQGRMR